MTINPIARTNAATATYTNTATPAATPANSQVWGQDEYVPGVEGSPYPSYPNVEDTPSQSRDEWFSAIIFKHGGGQTHETFGSMISELCVNGLITIEQADALVAAFSKRYIEAYLAEERRLGEGFDNIAFMASYRFSFDDLLAELMDLAKNDSTIDKNKDIIRELSEKAAVALRQYN